MPIITVDYGLGQDIVLANTSDWIKTISVEMYEWVVKKANETSYTISQRLVSKEYVTEVDTIHITVASENISVIV